MVYLLLRPVSWVKAARRDFEAFPEGVRLEVMDSLSILAAGGYPPTAKPLKGLGAGVYELVISHDGDAFRAVYAMKIDSEIWVVHVFQKSLQLDLRHQQKTLTL